MSERFIESPLFPIDIVNEASAKEKQGGGKPDFWKMVFWWTRKPLTGARTVIAGTLLPSLGEDIFVLNFRNWFRLDKPVAHQHNPVLPDTYRRMFANTKLLDPFAGFGSIPLEAVRLGIGEVVAVELLPVAYVFLKAVLEYPKWIAERGLAESLRKDVEKWGNWILDKLMKDPDIKELYDDNVAVYIGTWEIKCPACGRYTPLIGNWWLARVSKKAQEEGEENEEKEEVSKGAYARLAWMTPLAEGDRILIRVIDLNKKLFNKTIKATVNTREGMVKVEDKEYRVQRPNIDAKREIATCLHCNNKITGKMGEWLVKKHLRGWNENLERYLRGEISMEELKRQFVKPRFLIKVKMEERNVDFEPTTEEDDKKLWKALEKLKAMWGGLDIPTEELWKYTAGQGGAISIWIWGFDRFYKLFNPRQLLTLVKLVKLIREAGKKIKEEKQREGWGEEEAFRYAEAITTYLSMALCKYADFNSLFTRWNPGWLKFEESMSVRGIAMMWNWSDSSPFASLTGTLLNNLKNIIKSLTYLVFAVSGSSSKISVLLDDATNLSKLNDKRFDLIITDPPYRYDVPYAELSDFYYVWLKRSLCDIVNVGGVLIRQPRFLKEAFFDEFGNEIEVQWKVFASREVSEIEGRSKVWGSKPVNGKSVPVGSFDYFKYLLSESFKVMATRLVDDGILVTYYAHTSPEAWEALLEAAKSANLRLTSAHAIVTESKERVTARGKAGLDISIVAVWRRGVEGEVLASEAYARALRKCKSYAGELLKRGLEGVNLFVGVLGCVLSEFTKYKIIHGVRILETLVREYVYPATAEAIAKALAGVEAETKFSSPSLFYLLAKTLIEPRPRQITRVMDRSTLTILAIGTRSDMDELRGRLMLVKQDDDKFRLLEPPRGKRELMESARAVLDSRRVSIENPVIRSPVDILHLLEYYSLTLPQNELLRKVEELRLKYPSFYEEALRLARILSKLLKPIDPEQYLASKVSGSLTHVSLGLDYYLRGDK